jgi:general secretion pathway protein L
VNRLVIQLVKEHIDVNGDIIREFRWGDMSDTQYMSSDFHSGDGDALLAAVEPQAVMLLIPGQKVVSISLPYNKKEERYLLSLLPYQIEDDVLGDVNDLHFTVSNNKESDVVCAAYTDLAWLRSVIDWLSSNGLIVENCIADFQCLDVANSDFVIWFNEGQVWGHRVNGLGFNIDDSIAKLFLKDLFQSKQDDEFQKSISVYINDPETQKNIQENILPITAYDFFVGAPSFNFRQNNHLDFVRGKLSKKLPIKQWWGEAKALSSLAVAALVIFFITSFIDIYYLQQKQANVQDEIVDNFRKVVPSGSASVPVRRLKAMLISGDSYQQSSQATYLLSKMAPALEKLNIDLTSLNYSNREQVLRLNIKISAFSVVEQLRQNLEKQGVIAELQNSNATDDGFQARLRVSLMEAQNG